MVIDVGQANNMCSVSPTERGRNCGGSERDCSCREGEGERLRHLTVGKKAIIVVEHTHTHTHAAAFSGSAPHSLLT